MKTKFVPLLIIGASMCVSLAQNLPTTAPSAENRGQNTNAEDDLKTARDKLMMLKLKYTDVHPEVVNARKRVAELERLQFEVGGGGAGGTGGGGSVGRFGQRLQAVVRRGDAALPGSIIATSQMSQEKLDQLSEDLTVLNYIFTRNFERTFGEKGTEYRLGVPITMSGGRIVETSYLEDFGVLVKVHVPFPVVSSGDNDKKSEPASNADSDWEKARRALFGGGDGEGASPATEQIAPYDEKLVEELKRQMLDALKSAANIRNLEPNQPITVAIMGGPNFALKLAGGGHIGSANAARLTMMTIRITKAQADAAAKDSDANDLAKQAKVVAYFDSANANAGPRAGMTYGGGGFGGSSFGGSSFGGGSYGGYAPSAGPAPAR
jgi:hypothetical protein